MNSPRPQRPRIHRLLARLICMGTLGVFVWLNQGRTTQAAPAGGGPRQQADAVTGGTNAPSTGIAPLPTTGQSSPVAGGPGRPLPFALESAHFQWTSADAKDTNVIRQLAHNDAEYQRMVEENGRIQRRQLVYSKNTAAAIMQQSRLSGERVTHLTLPGFDGQELQFVIEGADLQPSKQVGTFTGRLVGQPGSLVTLAFKFGREAFTIISPEGGMFLQGHPREPGEIILTSFDPDTYMPLPCGGPIKTSQ